MHILYLEDSKPDIRLVQQYMNTLSHRFVTVETIDAARQYLTHEQPDIFLVDIVIGRETADDLIEQAVRQGLSKYIVAVTAKALPAEVKCYLELGCDQVITKPFTIDDLEHTLNELV